MTTLSAQVKVETAAFLKENLDAFKADAKSSGCFDVSSEHEMYDAIPGMDLTLATDGNQWSYQTGDNSYTGGAYSLPHWAVLTIMPDTTYQELYKDTIDQWEELIA